MDNVSTRLFAVTTELVTLPTILEDKKCREIFNTVSESHNIKSYTTLPDGSVQMSSNEMPPDIGRYRIMWDRISISFEYCSKALSYYSGLIKSFAETYAKVTKMQLFLMDTNVIRKLVNIRGVEDGREFLIKKVYKLEEKNFAPFGRPLHMLGGRMFFPPLPEDTTSHEIKTESFMDDYRSIYIEDKAVFSQPVDINNMKNIETNINKTDDFINNNIIQFLTQFL